MLFLVVVYLPSNHRAICTSCLFPIFVVIIVEQQQEEEQQEEQQEEQEE